MLLVNLLACQTGVPRLVVWVVIHCERVTRSETRRPEVEDVLSVVEPTSSDPGPCYRRGCLMVQMRWFRWCCVIDDSRVRKLACVLVPSRVICRGLRYCRRRKDSGSCHGKQLRISELPLLRPVIEWRAGSRMNSSFGNKQRH